MWNGGSTRIIFQSGGAISISWKKLDWKTWQYEKRYDRDNEITFDSDCDSYVDGYNRNGFYQWTCHLESIFAFIFISNM